MSDYLITPFGTVAEQACDYNGHFNEAQSLVLLTVATDTLLDTIGLDASERDRLQFSAFTVQNQIYYRAEAHLGDQLYSRTQLLGFDNKRLRIYHQLIREADQQIISEMECLMLGVSMTTRKVSLWPESVADGMRRLADLQYALPMPETAGQGISRPGLLDRY